MKNSSDTAKIGESMSGRASPNMKQTRRKLRKRGISTKYQSTHGTRALEWFRVAMACQHSKTLAGIQKNGNKMVSSPVCMFITVVVIYVNILTKIYHHSILMIIYLSLTVFNPNICLIPLSNHNTNIYR